MHNTLYQLYNKTAQKYRKLSSRLEKSITSGRFWKETKYRQNQLVNRVEKIRLKLERLELQLRIAIAGGLVIAGLIGTSDYASAQGLGPFIEITDRSVHPLPPPLEWTFNLKAYPSYADLDGDGDIDLFVTINSNLNYVYPYADDEVLYYENQYNILGRHFALQNPSTPFVNIISGFADRRMPEFVDIDNDGDLDAFTNKGYSSVATEIIFLYNNNGVFEDRTASPTNPFSGISFDERSLSFVDLDGDGDFDAFAGSQFLENIGDATNGNFYIAPGPPHTFTYYDVKHLAFIDMDSDGDQDAITADSNGYLHFFRNKNVNAVPPFQTDNWTQDDGEPRFTPLNGIKFGTEAIPKFVDIDNDGDLDLMVMTTNIFFPNPPSAIQFWENDGNNYFSLTPGLSNPFGGVDVGDFANPAWGDIDGDGDMDLFVGSQNNGVLFYEQNNIGFGDYFLPKTGAKNPLNIVGTPIYTSPALADMDNDGDLDAYVGTSGTLQYHRNDGSTLSPSFITDNPSNSLVNAIGLSLHNEYLNPTLGDIDNDGDIDAYINSGYSVGRSMDRFVNTGNPTPPTFAYDMVNGQFPYYIGDRDVQLVDIDHDGDLDLIAGGYYSVIGFFENQSSTFVRQTGALNPFNSIYDYFSAPSFIDSDNDGDLDMFLGDKYGQIRFFRNDNQPPAISINAAPLTVTENDPAVLVDPAVSVADPDATPNNFIINGSVSISGYVNGEDVLNFTGQPNITETWNPATGILTLSDVATFAEYQAFIQSITYTNLSDNPGITKDIVFVLTDNDNTNPVPQQRTINITPVNDPPSITSTAGLTATEETLYTYTAGVNDPDDANNGTDITWSLLNQPAGMVINSTGVVNWTPGEGVLTSGTVTLSVEDGDEDGSPPDTQVFTITVTPVNDPPSITSTAPTTADEGVLYTYTATVSDPDDANDGTSQLTWSLAGQPAGMTVSTTGVVTWTPGAGITTSGPVNLTVQDGGEDGATPDSETFTITVTPANSPPVLTSTSTDLTYAADSGPVIIDPAITVQDADSDIASATISISSNFVSAEDVLDFTSSGTITGSYDSSTGILSLSGAGTVAEYEAVLQSVTYENLNSVPTLTNRIVTFIVNDGIDPSNTATRTISVTFNAPPTVIVSASVLNYTENDGPVAIDPGIVAGDDSPQLAAATVTIASNYQNGEDVLSFTDQNGITGSFDAAGGVLTLSGNATVVSYQTALASVTYENLSDNPVTTDRSVTFSVSDGTNSSAPVSRTIQVSAVNDAPVITATAPAVTFTEGDPDRPVITGITITDPDNILMQSASVTVSMNYISGEDVLNFTTLSGISGSFDAATGVLSFTGNATLADYQTIIESVTYANMSENPSAAPREITIVLNDGTDGSNAEVSTITVVPVNDPPVLAGTSSDISYRSLTGSIVIDDQISISDVDNTDINRATVLVSANYSAGEDILGFTDQNGISGSFNSVAGVLTLSGTASIAVYQAALASITYENTVAAPSAATKQISFTVTDASDQSNTATRTINVTPNQVIAATINTQAGIGGSITIDVQGQATFDPADQITTTITTDPVMGVAVVNADGSITYTPNADAFGTDQISYELCNQLNSCDSETITIDIQNEAPVVQVLEGKADPGGTATINLGDAISDVNNNLDISSIIVLFQPTSGAIVTIDADLNLTVDYSGTSFTGADRLTIEVCDLSGACTEQEIIIIVGELKKVNVFNAVSPNGDGMHEFLNIQDIEFFASNEVFIYDKLGRLVYSQENYDNSDPDRVFVGVNNDGEELLNGTYYYVILLTSVEGNKFRQSGFFLIQR